MMWWHKLRKNQKGQSLLELAIALPVILLIVFGALEFGRIFHSYIIITHAAREGVRIGALGATDAEIINRIREAASLPQANTNLNITRIEPNQSARISGMPLTVEVTYDVDLVTPLFSNILPNPFTLTTQATMRLE